MPCPTPEEVDALLPQTQCGLCGFGGCMPYAEALVYEKASINLCPPGGVATLKALGLLLQQDPTPYLDELAQKEKPRMIAVIREDECIGCTKCIPVCPVDAILGSAKKMHTVITDECTGCELCVAPCPVDCIDLIEATSQPSLINNERDQERKNIARIRFNQKQQRISRDLTLKKSLHQDTAIQEKKNYISEAIARAKTRKNKDIGN